MSDFASRARLLHDCLLALTLQVREIRGLLLVDRNGLALVSTLHSRGLEESLAAFAGGVLGAMDRAQGDFQMGPLHLLHLAGRDRQVLLTPVSREAVLVGVVEASANGSDTAMRMLALAREILETVRTPSADAPGATESLKAD